MKVWRVRGGKPLRGRAAVPGDKSIGHRALLFAGLARTPSILHGVSRGEDNESTAQALREMGVRIERDGDTTRVEGLGLRGLRMPKGVLNCGNSGTTMRLVAGLLSAQRFGTRLVGDASLSQRPMNRILGPLQARGAYIEGTRDQTRDEDERYAPLSVAPLLEGETLLGIQYEMPVASAQVKSCLLISGLYANGPTLLREPFISRDHTERMLASLGVPLQTMGTEVALDPREWEGGWDGFEWTVPGDFSSAAFLLGAALAVPGSRVVVEGVGVNPTRTGFLDALRMMGVAVQHSPRGECGGAEPWADLELEGRGLRASVAADEMVVRMIDEVPIWCVIAAVARGKSELLDAKELRVKESDRIAAMSRVLNAFGVPVEEREDGLLIEGGGPRRAAHVKSEGDHRIAMSAAILALATEGESTIEDVDCVETSFPGFVACLKALGADIEIA